MEKTVVLETSYGKVKGIQLDGRQLFKGIRYAKAERFQKPVLCVSDDEVYDATKFGYTCPQPGQPEGSFYDREFWHHKEYSTEKNEDCLFLNIWKPDHAKNLPVAMWIHGGAFMNGFSSKVEIDGEYWNKKGVILVSINYRVGVLGFLTSHLLDQAYGDSGNYGIYDQIAAIEWIHKHIASFGGDPDHITIMGQSAGAMSVQTLLGAPALGEGVVGAVMHSGGGIRNWMNESVSKEQMLEWHDDFLKTQGIDTLEKLLAADPMDLVWSSGKYTSEKMGMKLMFIPHISEDILPDTYEALAEQGRLYNVPYIVGCTKNDITVGEAGVYESPVYQGCINLAEAMNKKNHKPVYIYIFGQDPLGGEGQGSFHSCDLWYSFHTLDRSWREKQDADYQAADEMCSRWIDFISTGEPNDPELSRWEPFNGDSASVHKFGSF